MCPPIGAPIGLPASCHSRLIVGPIANQAPAASASQPPSRPLERCELRSSISPPITATAPGMMQSHSRSEV